MSYIYLSCHFWVRVGLWMCVKSHVGCYWPDMWGTQYTCIYTGVKLAYPHKSSWMFCKQTVNSTCQRRQVSQGKVKVHWFVNKFLPQFMSSFSPCHVKGDESFEIQNVTKTFKRNPKIDYPVLLVLELVGNDVCNQWVKYCISISLFYYLWSHTLPNVYNLHALIFV